jgi:hypothetical protein
LGFPSGINNELRQVSRTSLHQQFLPFGMIVLINGFLILMMLSHFCIVFHLLILELWQAGHDDLPAVLCCWSMSFSVATNFDLRFLLFLPQCEDAEARNVAIFAIDLRKHD